jgi:glyoxylase-like metal-dependent hydrolase (beta-lactamase superfamily II)
MRINILGTRGEIARSAPRHRRHAGVLIDRRILLDFGEASYRRYRPKAIFISHLHPDHAVFVATPLAATCAVYVPEPTPALPSAIVLPGAVEIGPYRVVPVPTEHSHRVRSVGFIVEKGACRLFYSSDLVSVGRRSRAALGRLDLVITDGSFMRRGGLVRTDAATGLRYGHAGIPDLVQFFSRFSHQIIISHFGSWFYEDIPRARRRIATLSDVVRVRAAFDGMVVTV